MSRLKLIVSGSGGSAAVRVGPNEAKTNESVRTERRWRLIPLVLEGESVSGWRREARCGHDSRSAVGDATEAGLPGSACPQNVH